MAGEDLKEKHVPRSGPGTMPPMESVLPFLNVSELAYGPRDERLPSGPETTYTNGNPSCLLGVCVDEGTHSITLGLGTNVVPVGLPRWNQW